VSTLLQKSKTASKASKGKTKTKSKKEGVLRENIEMILEVLVLVFFINAFLLQSFGIPTPSMEDNMLVGDHLLVDKVAYSKSLSAVDGFVFPQLKLKRGMIVVFKSPPEVEARNMDRLTYVKRILGLPGELIEIVDNQIFINGAPIDEPYTYIRGEERVPTDFPPESPVLWWDEFPAEFRDSLVQTDMGMAFKIPEGHYFCMGDNRNLSADSRIWGPVPEEYIIGKPWRIYWSFAASTDHFLNKGFFQRLVSTLGHFFTQTRWNRFLKKY
jgi:signal peptidase I